MGRDAISLARILKNAKNCHTIGLDGWERPWGARIAKRETGFFPTSSTDWVDTKDFIRRVIHVIIAALTTSEGQITTLVFETALEQTHLHPRMLDFPDFCLDGNLPWIASLKTLRLVVDPDCDGDPDGWAETS